VQALEKRQSALSNTGTDYTASFKDRTCIANENAAMEWSDNETATTTTPATPSRRLRSVF
jgi:hypothetical protein